MFGKGNSLSGHNLLFYVLLLYSTTLIIVMAWLSWSENMQNKKVLENYQEKNDRLLKDLYRQHEEINNMEEQITYLEEILDLRKEMYREVIIKEQGVNFDITRPSGFTGEMLEKSFGKYAGGALKGAGEDFVEMEREEGLNAVAAAGICANETGWGTSRLAREKNNYFGWSAFDHDPYTYALDFISREHSINYVGKRIKENYLKAGGEYYHGPTLAAMNKNYASDVRWAEKVASAMEKIIENAISPEEAAWYNSYREFERKHPLEVYYYLRYKNSSD